MAGNASGADLVCVELAQLAKNGGETNRQSPADPAAAGARALFLAIL